MLLTVSFCDSDYDARRLLTERQLANAAAQKADAAKAAAAKADYDARLLADSDDKEFHTWGSDDPDDEYTLSIHPDDVKKEDPAPGPVDPAEAMSKLLGDLDGTLAEQQDMLELNGDLEAIIAGLAEQQLTCSRAGMARALAQMEAKYSKPWELCQSCGGDLLHMFELVCFEKGALGSLIKKHHPSRKGEYIPVREMDKSVLDALHACFHPSRTLSSLSRKHGPLNRELRTCPQGTIDDIAMADPGGIRNLLTSKEALSIQSWGEEPAQLCMVGCLPGYRRERTIKTAMLAYECQVCPPPPHPPPHPHPPVYARARLLLLPAAQLASAPSSLRFGERCRPERCRPECAVEIEHLGDRRHQA